MLLTHETTIVLNKNDANIVGHMCYAAYKLWNVCNYERNNYKKIWDWRNILTGIIRSPSIKRRSVVQITLSQTAQEICRLLDKSWKFLYRLKRKWRYRELEHQDIRKIKCRLRICKWYST